jgi:hypothetical protein
MMRSTPMLLVIAVGCASQPSMPKARFANAPIARRVNDRVNVPAPPHAAHAMLEYHAYKHTFARPVARTLQLRAHRRAEGVNAIDEVPDSTWYTNRRGLSLEQMRTGPIRLETPERHVPWTIEGTGSGGSSIGFVIRDARGIKYQIKFDTLGLPEAETAADAIASRLIWACGYNVPEDQVVFVSRDQLRIAPDAMIKSSYGKPLRRLGQRDVDEMLAQVERGPSGQIRAIASRWLDGRSLGPPAFEGVRKDDPNDLIPHEQRRDLRGLQVVYAWLDMVDVVPNNLLDMWIEDPADPSRHYIKHYLLDFGSSLGVLGTKARDRRSGQTYRVDWEDIFQNLITGGLATTPQGRRGTIAIPGVTPLFEADAFDPARWRAEFPYIPFKEMDRFDAFWGAKLVARFTRAQIHAAVEAGRFEDPRAVEYITDTLVARQRKTAQHWFRQVNPLDAFEVDDQVCFDDLAIAYGFEAAAATRYVITANDRLGRTVGRPIAAAAGHDGHTCISTPPLAADPERYTIFEIETTRRDFRGTTYLHVASAGAGAPRVIGVWRE